MLDIAVLVNLHARRGSEAVADACRAAIPGGRVLLSRSLDEAADFAATLRARPPELIVSAGGDGTAVSLLNALRAPRAAAAAPAGAEDSLFGVLPLGTGNGWARTTGAPSWRTGVKTLGAVALTGDPLPFTRFDLVEIDGVAAHFAGTGWDAEIIDDFHAQMEGGLLWRRARTGLAGYLYGMTTRTIPRHLFMSRVEVELTNLGEEALGVDENGQAAPIPGMGPGAVLYRGPVSVCGAGTSPEWGFGFRAFPFAGSVPGRFCMRVYTGSVLEATLRMRSLWRGRHPIPKMLTFLLQKCRAVFSRPVPLQIGGDCVGLRQEIEYGIAAQPIDVLDWRKLARA